MPLHLLGKKTWNVYNPGNIARVRQDEAHARAREEADEQRMQDEEACRRLAILRGEEPLPLPDTTPDRSEKTQRNDKDERGQRRKRKRPGEDDTDFEIRAAHERAKNIKKVVLRAQTDHESDGKKADVSLYDSSGHFSLFKAEEELATRNDTGSFEDSRRIQRAAARLEASDPLATMKQGAASVRGLNQERQREATEREAKLREQCREYRKRPRDGRRDKRTSDRLEAEEERTCDQSAGCGQKRAIYVRHRHCRSSRSTGGLGRR